MAHASHAAPATRPALEVADILRKRGDAYRETHRLSVQQQRVVDALVNCRTAVLGGFKAHCDHCGAETIQYASCRNRHCPKCQTLAQTRWVERQCADLPRGFTRLRHYGLLANRSRTRKLALCRALLGQPAPEPLEPETTQEMMLRLTGIDITVCRRCGRGPLRQILILDLLPQTVMRATKTRPP